MDESDRPEILNDAIDIVRDVCNPEGIVVYGPTAVGYVDDRHVNLLVIKDCADVRETGSDKIRMLARNHIDGYITVVTPALFRKNIRLSYTESYNAVKTGHVVEVTSEKFTSDSQETAGFRDCSRSGS